MDGTIRARKRDTTVLNQKNNERWFRISTILRERKDPVPFGEPDGGISSNDLDYTLFSLQPTPFAPSVGLSVLEKTNYDIVTAHPEGHDVMAITATTGIVRGVMLGHPRLVKLPGCKVNFQYLWTVKLNKKIRKLKLRSLAFIC